MADNVTREEIAARLEAVEARTEAKFTQIMSRFDTVAAELKADTKIIATRLDGLERATSGTKTTIIVTGLAIITLVVAILSFGQQWFGIGVSTRDIVKSAVTDYVQQQNAHSTPPANKP